jgi:hypothetical protein
MMGMGALLRDDRLPVVMACGALVVLGMGGWHTYRGLRDGKQVEMTCGEYSAVRPEGHWLKLTDCEYDFDHYAIKKNGSSIDKVYVPVRPYGDTTSKAQIVVMRDDKLTRNVVEQWEDHRTPSDAALDHLRIELNRPIEGIVSSGLDLDADDKDKLGPLKIGLANDYVMIDADAKPHLIAGILATIGGLLLAIAAAFLFVFGRRYRRNNPPPPPRVPPPRWYGPPPARQHDPNNPIRTFERPV